MFKNNLLRKVVVTTGITILALSSISALTNVKAATTSDTTSDSTYQMFPIDYVNQLFDGLQSNITIPAYQLPDNVDGNYRTYDQFLSGDMTSWLGQTNLNFAKSIRSPWLTDNFKYRLSPKDGDYNTFYTQTVPDLKKNGGTTTITLQVLNNYNYSQVLTDHDITITVPALDQLNVNYSDTTTVKGSATSNVFTNVYQLPDFTIQDAAGKTYQATNVKPASDVYLNGQKTAISALPKQLAAGTYTQSIYFSVDQMDAAKLKLLAANSQIVGNNGNSNIRYSGGQLIATRTVIVQ